MSIPYEEETVTEEVIEEEPTPDLVEDGPQHSHPLSRQYSHSIAVRAQNRSNRHQSSR